MDILNSDNKSIQNWIKLAQNDDKTIVFPEAGFSPRIVDAGVKCAQNNICKVIFLVDNNSSLKHIDDENIKIINYLDHELIEVLAEALYIKRKEKGVTKQQAFDLIKSPIYFGTMMVELGLADGLVCGAEGPTKDTFLPAFQIIKAKQGRKASSFFAMFKDDQAYLIGDCGLNINPSSEDLAGIAIQTAENYSKLIGQEPKVALLSYSTNGSAGGESAEKVVNAVKILDQMKVDFKYEGEMQLDAAIVPEVANKKFPNGRVKGDANVLIFPDLQSGNIGYKLIQRFGGYVAVGPLGQGFNKPINDVSRGSTVDDIILITVVTVLQS